MLFKSVKIKLKGLQEKTVIIEAITNGKITIRDENDEVVLVDSELIEHINVLNEDDHHEFVNDILLARIENQVVEAIDTAINIVSDDIESNPHVNDCDVIDRLIVELEKRKSQ